MGESSHRCFYTEPCNWRALSSLTTRFVVIMVLGLCALSCTEEEKVLCTHGGRRIWRFTHSFYVVDKDVVKIYLMHKRKGQYSSRAPSSCAIFDILVIHVPENALSEAEQCLGYRIVRKAYFVGHIGEPYKAWAFSTLTAGRVDILDKEEESQTYRLNIMFHCIGIDEDSSQQTIKSWDIDFVGKIKISRKRDDIEEIRKHILEVRKQVSRLVDKVEIHKDQSENLESLIPEPP